MSETTIALVDRLVEQFDALRPMLREHLSDNFGEVLPHLFFGDITRYAVSRTIEAQGATVQARKAIQQELDELLHTLEQVYSEGNEELEELISVSFLENLPREAEPGSDIRLRLGPLLRQQLEVIG